MSRRAANRLPESVLVSGVRFSIAWEHTFDDCVFGDTDVHDRKVRMGDRCKIPAERASTLFHELMHCALGVAGFGEMLEEKLEEAIVTCLENALYPHLEMIVRLAKAK